MSTEVKAGIQNLLKGLIGLVEVAAYFVSAASLFCFLPSVVIPFDLFCHFRMQYLVLLILCAVPLIARKKWIVMTAVSTAIAANLFEIVPLFLKLGTAQSGARVLCIIDINFNSGNTNFESLRALLNENEPDILCWQEFSPAAEIWAKHNLTDYRYSKQIPRHDNFGIAIFSKLPVTKFEDKKFSDVNIETLIATVQASTPLQVICTHTYPPITAAALHTRDLQLENLGAFVREGGQRTILCGDLNATSWSDSFKRLLKESALVDSRHGFGVQPSWPDGLGPMMIPIDHVLVDPRFGVLSRKLGPSVNSDHLPVIVKLAL